MSFYPYSPRKLNSHLGIWDCGSHRFKVYGIVAENRSITDSVTKNARQFLEKDVIERIRLHNDSDGLGFVIIHPGSLGTSVLAHWWIQGSVLCQLVKRWLPGSPVPIDMSEKNVLGCVWELGLIHAEQMIWRDTMMGEAADPDNYLGTVPDISTV